MRPTDAASPEDRGNVFEYYPDSRLTLRSFSGDLAFLSFHICTNSCSTSFPSGTHTWGSRPTAESTPHLRRHPSCECRRYRC